MVTRKHTEFALSKHVVAFSLSEAGTAEDPYTDRPIQQE